MKSSLKNTIAALFTGAVLCSSPASMLGSYAAVSGIWPTQPEYTIITTQFDPTRNIYNVSGYHNAIDIQADYNTNIYAAYAGTVKYSGWLDGYGYIVILYHADLGIYTFYAHASSLIVSAGASVSQGQIIAKVGSTGVSSGNHLHFGVCSSLDGTGYPSVTFYDPLTYFTFSNNTASNSVAAANSAANAAEETVSGFTSDYAGVYTTKGVVTYLNIRSGNSVNYSAIGKVPAGAEVSVTSADGSWAQVEYNGVSGYCSMDYLQRTAEIQSEMNISDFSFPESNTAYKSSLAVKGIIDSALPITKVWGGVYTADSKATEQYAQAAPGTLTYDLSNYFDSQIALDKLEPDSYIYRIEAEDQSGQTYTLINTEFTVKAPETQAEKTKDAAKVMTGDLNGDSDVTVADGVILQNYLLHKSTFTAEQFFAADMNGNGSVDVFDMIVMKQSIVE